MIMDRPIQDRPLGLITARSALARYPVIPLAG
jgi:hypothetical protein